MKRGSFILAYVTESSFIFIKSSPDTDSFLLTAWQRCHSVCINSTQRACLSRAIRRMNKFYVLIQLNVSKDAKPLKLSRLPLSPVFAACRNCNQSPGAKKHRLQMFEDNIWMFSAAVISFILVCSAMLAWRT